MEEFLEKNYDFKNEIISLISENINSNNLETLLEEYHLYDISRVIIDFEDKEIVTFFNTVSLEFAAEIFEYLEQDEAKYFLKIIKEETGAKIITEMDLDDAVDLLKYLKKTGMRILKRINQEKRKEILKLMLYEEDEIGAYLTDSFLSIKSDISVKEAMKQITSLAHDVDYISIIYVVDEHELLIGYIKLKDLIVARANEMIFEIMKERFPRVYPTDDKEYVASLMQQTSESSIPIINEDGRLEGIITHDDLIDIISLAQEEDYTRFAGLGEGEIRLDTSTLRKSISARLPWLSILLLLSMVTSIILSFFEGSLSGSDGARLLATRLAIYLPLILDMSGNTGTQSLAVMIRYLTKNPEVDSAKIKKHIYREFRTGLLQGLFIGTSIFLMITITNQLSLDLITRKDNLYAIVTAFSILVALIVSTTLGAFVPLVMNKLKIDPAVASGPFITTISDIITLSIYYTIAMLLLLPLFQ